MNLKKKLLAGVGVATLAGMSVLAGPAFAVTPVNGTGNASCSHLTGSIKFSPAYKNGGTATSTTITVKTTATNCSASGGNVTTITKIQSKGSSHGTSNDCSSLTSPSSNPLTVTSKYKATPKINPSTTVFTSTTPGVSGSDATFTVAGSNTAGSFNGNAVSATANVGPIANIVSKCGSNGGLKSLKIVSGNLSS
ncbi:MAG: hypothetical protein JWL83_122 [Actinomycetia bacterium]|nr:hypothetical protein [Actinomycetes bacterium]